ncbi:MAG: AAA family ATPase [Synergistaceae bacterium]|jgi:DNA repair protein RecN (Recombination protein N)|nr:AAA family ATPase [Synergistaceae bacterium]
MIEELYVRGVGGVRSAALSFRGDFIVITGESGAGKSSLVRAFEFVSGRRAQTTAIHAGFDEAAVEAVWNEERGGEKLITKRYLSRLGKGKCLIHGELATVSQLFAESLRLIEIQSQFAQLNLLDPSRQLALVDSCGGAELAETRERLAELFPRMLSAEKNILEIKKRRRVLEAEMERAPERVRVIKSLSLYNGCEAEWEAELKSLEKRLEEADRYGEILERMTGGEGGEGFADQMSSLLRNIYGIAPETSLAHWTELGELALSNLQELFALAQSELGLISREELEAGLDRVEAKVGSLRKVKRETGIRSSDELLAYIDDVEEKMKWLGSSRLSLEKNQAEAARMRAEAGMLARRLRVLRERAALDFGARVNGHLADLAMDGARFRAEIVHHDRVRVSGAESAVFMLAQNDSAAGPVSKVASGGELSRILIAIQASLGETDKSGRGPGVLVFDEVEAGLGGRTALLAGEKLRELSRNNRIILITHEAAIAAMASQHFVVRRTGDETEVFEISGEERAREIARMLAGSESAEAMEHARALLGLNGPEDRQAQQKDGSQRTEGQT